MSERNKQLPATGIFRHAKRIPGMDRASEAYVLAMQFRALLTRSAFVLLVVAPTMVATVFYGLIASPRYASEARFIVRSVSAPRMSGIDVIFRTFGLSKTVDDAYVIQKYLLSRDAVRGLIAEGLDLKAIFTLNGADFLSRYPRPWRQDNFEGLYDYYLDRVTVREDSVKGILTLESVAFRAEDARALTSSLLTLAERVVNRMNERAQSDIMTSAMEDVRRAEASVLEAQKNITAFRNREILVDPSKSSLSVIETIGNLSTDLAYASANLKEMQISSPANPSISGLKAKISALEERIKAERSKMAGTDSALSNKISTYEQLALKRELADKMLAASLGALDTARQDARRQHIYVEDIVSANMPEESNQPERLRGIATVFVLGFALFSIVWILTVGAGEHAQ